ncbi:hypothetical protein DL95DRAFT_453039 [Leptodontidium sp. 2 PMI_412]|nr:hypothetical protein DL95DRAFT_453039 [Leptodontidium sp. 2 PMI_412]
MHLPAGLEVSPAGEMEGVGKSSSGVAGSGTTTTSPASKFALADSKDSGASGNYLGFVTYSCEFHLDIGAVNSTNAAQCCLFCKVNNAPVEISMILAKPPNDDWRVTGLFYRAREAGTGLGEDRLNTVHEDPGQNVFNISGSHNWNTYPLSCLTYDL